MKFDLKEFVSHYLLEQDEDQDQENQNATPEDNQQSMKDVSSPFDEFKEGTVEDIKFEPATNGGSLVIKFKESGRPLTISWQNNRAYIQKPNGDTVQLM